MSEPTENKSVEPSSHERIDLSEKALDSIVDFRPETTIVNLADPTPAKDDFDA